MTTGRDIDGSREGQFTSERETIVLELLKQLGGEAYYTQIYDLMLELPNEKRMSKDLLSKTLNRLVEGGFVKRNPPIEKWRRGQKATYTLTSLEQEIYDSKKLIKKFYYTSCVKIFELWKAVEEKEDLQELKKLYNEAKDYRDFFDSNAFLIVKRFKGKLREGMSNFCQVLSNVIDQLFKVTFNKYPEFIKASNVFDERTLIINTDVLSWAKEKGFLKDSEIDFINSFIKPE